MSKALILVLALAAAGVTGGTRGGPGGCDLAQGSCCCTLPNGLQCCGTASNCESGVIPGCDCAKGDGGRLF